MDESVSADEQILAGLRDADKQERAFLWLMKNYQKRVYGLVIKIVFDHHDADDVTQDTFIKAWERAAEVRDPEKLKAWLFKVATNEALRLLKKKRVRRYIPLHQNLKLENVVDENPHFSGEQAEKAFFKAMSKLSDRQRAVFNMRYFEEMKYEEISDIMDAKVGTLKATYHQSVEKLKKVLGDGW